MEIKVPEKSRLKRAFAVFLAIYILISSVLLLWSTGGNLREAFAGVNFTWLIPAILSSLLFLALDSLRLHFLSVGFGKPFSPLYAAEIILSGFLLAVTTPFGSGGLPYQLWLLSRRGYGVGEGFLLLMSRGFVLFIPYILFLPLVYASIDSTVLRYIFFYAVLVVVLVLIGVLVRKDFREKLLSIRYNYLLYAILVSFPAQVVYLSMLYFILRSRGIDAGYVETLSTQLLLQLTTYFSPSPGGLGISEAISSLILSADMGRENVGMVVLLWRFFTSYMFALMGFFVVMRRISSDTLKFGK